MLKLKGIVTIILVDSITGSRRVIEKTNLIPANTLLELAAWKVGGYFSSCNISISSQTITPSLSNHTLTEILATGYQVESPTWNPTIDPPFGQLHQRIDFIGESRVFNTIGLTRLTANNNYGNPGIDSTTYAYLLMDTPCTQGETEVIDIYYRIQFVDAGGQGFINNDKVRYDFGKSLFSNIQFFINELYTTISNTPPLTYNALAPTFEFDNNGNPTGIAGYNYEFNFPIGWSSGVRVDSHYKFKYTLTKTREEDIGLIYNTLFQGVSDDNSEVYTTNPFTYLEEPFQTSFWHSDNANTPFFDPSTFGNSNGMIYLSGNWQGSFPELYKIEIVTSGNTSIATYKFSIMKHVGFNGNNYTSRLSRIPFLNSIKQPAPGIHGWQELSFDKLFYGTTKLVQYDSTGVTLIDLMSGAYSNYDSTNGLNANSISQVAVDPANSKIYVGCRNTGLWVINTLTNTLTHPLNNPCYGVDVGRNGIVFAIVNGGLHSSSNSFTTPLTFSVAEVNNSWSNVYFLKADSQHINNQLAILYDAGSSIKKIAWHEASSNTTTQGFGETFLRTYPASLKCTEEGSRWYFFLPDANFAQIDFNAVFYNIQYSAYNRFINGVFYSKVCTYKDSIITPFGIEGGTFTYTFSQSVDNTVLVLPLDSGIALTSLGLRQLFNGDAPAWTNYGWNGSSWVKDNSGAKTTHTTNQTLINGLQIRFENGTASPQFTATNYFTQGVNKGLLKDNATDITYSSAYYTIPAVFDNPVQGGLSVPASSPYEVTLSATTQPGFIRIETDSLELAKLTIAENPVLKVYNDGTPPAPQEVSLDPTGNGIVTFNSADAGKAVGGVYSYLRF